PKRRLPFGRPAGNGSRLAEQVARLCGGTELVAHHCKAAQRAQVGRLAFEKAPIDLLGGTQEILAGRRARQSCGGPECKSLFVHERDWTSSGDTRVCPQANANNPAPSWLQRRGTRAQ